MDRCGSSRDLLEYPLSSGIPDSTQRRLDVGPTLSQGCVLTGMDVDTGTETKTGGMNTMSCESDTSKMGKKFIKRIRKPDSNTQNLETFNCGICNKAFHSKHGVRFHEKYRHEKPKLYCLVCKKPFKISYDLDRHMKTHTGNRPFKCNDCEKTFVCKSSLMQHVRLKHIIGDIYKCPVCDKGFNKESDLERHSSVHSGEKRFQCSQCTKAFSCKSSLKVHERSHDGKKYACSFCKKHFYEQCDLKRHETVHTGVKPWRCKVCDKGYSCKSTLGVHLKNTHTKTPTPDMFLYHKQTESKTVVSKDHEETTLLSQSQTEESDTGSESEIAGIDKDVSEELKSDNKSTIVSNNEQGKDKVGVVDPYQSIELINDKTQTITDVLPSSVYMYQVCKGRRKAKFVRKLEVSDNCLVMCKK